MPSSQRAVFTMRSIFLRSDLLSKGLSAGLSFGRFLNNARHLLLGVCLPHEGGIVVVGAVRPNFRPDKPGLVKLPGHHLGRLAIALVHSKEKEREHDRDHGKGRKAQIAAAPDKKVDRHTDQCAGPEADDLPFGQAEQNLGFDPRQVPRDGNIGCHVVLLL